MDRAELLNGRRVGPVSHDASRRSRRDHRSSLDRATGPGFDPLETVGIRRGTGQEAPGFDSETGFPDGLVSAVCGKADVGQALIGSGTAKAIFTGGFEGGRAVLAELGRRGIPALAELSGVDAKLAQTRVIHARKPGGFRPHLFPYSDLMPRIFSVYRSIFHPRG